MFKFSIFLDQKINFYQFQKTINNQRFMLFMLEKRKLQSEGKFRVKQAM